MIVPIVPKGFPHIENIPQYSAYTYWKGYIFSKAPKIYLLKSISCLLLLALGIIVLARFFEINNFGSSNWLAITMYVFGFVLLMDGAEWLNQSLWLKYELKLHEEGFRQYLKDILKNK